MAQQGQVVDDTGRPTELRAVAEYRHLGAIQSADGSNEPGLRARVASALAARATITPKVLKFRTLPVRTRVAIGESLVLSRLF